MTMDDLDSYSISDMCPHSISKPPPNQLDPQFMSHAQHTAAPISALADTLCAIPLLSNVMNAASEFFSGSGR